MHEDTVNPLGWLDFLLLVIAYIFARLNINSFLITSIATSYPTTTVHRYSFDTRRKKKEKEKFRSAIVSISSNLLHSGRLVSFVEDISFLLFPFCRLRSSLISRIIDSFARCLKEQCILSNFQMQHADIVVRRFYTKDSSF